MSGFIALFAWVSYPQNMNLALEQLGRLLRGSIPTIIFLVLLYWIYTLLLHRPLVRVLEKRRSLTEGALEKAKADIAAAEARTADYENRLREARAAVFRTQEARRRELSQAREAALAQARSKAQAQVDEARVALDQDKLAAQSDFQAQTGKLAEEIIRVVLRPAAGVGN